MYHLRAKEVMEQKRAEEDAKEQAGQQVEDKTKPAQSKTRKQRGSFIGRMIRWLIILSLLAIGTKVVFPAQWNDLADNVPLVEKVDQWMEQIETPLREKWNILFPPVPSSKEVEQLLERSNQIGAVYSKDGTYAMMCYNSWHDYSYTKVDWGRRSFRAINLVSEYGSINSLCIVLKAKYSGYLEEDTEHVARLDVSSHFKSWLGAGRNSTITDIRAVWVPEAAPENQRSFTHYNIHAQLKDNRTGEIFWACYILEADAPSETWIPSVPNELLSLCSLQDLSVEEAASLLLGRDAVYAAEVYEKEMALRSDGSARAAEIKERLNTGYNSPFPDDYTPYFTMGADTVLYGSYMNWTSEVNQITDQWLHVFRYSNIRGIYDISDLDNIEAAEYLDRALDEAVAFEYH